MDTQQSLSYASHNFLLRSFVRRSRPLSKAQQQSYKQLAKRYLLVYERENQLTLDLGAVFSEKPLFLEIGFGCGDATWQIAKRYPQYAYLAVDIYKPGILRLMKKCEQEKLENLRLIEADALELLKYGLAKTSFKGVHFFFPDPWPKKRHWRRRFLQKETLTLLAKRVEVGGYLYFVSDWKNYAEQVYKEIMEHPEWQFLPAAKKPWRTSTTFEKKALAQGHTIFEHLCFRKKR